MSSFSLEDLARTIAERAGSGDPHSYTAKLVARGVSQCAKKFGEEAFELALASVEGDRRHVTAEAADLLYHLLVLLHASGVSLEDVKTELAGRTGQTGLQEKAARGAKA